MIVFAQRAVRLFQGQGWGLARYATGPCFIACPRAGAALHFSAQEPLPYSSPEARFHISNEQRYHEDIFHWINEHDGDPAFKHFVPHLKDHILARLLGREDDGGEYKLSEHQHGELHFEHNRIYFHKVCRVNYTTYDMRHAQDSINLRTHPDIMLRAHEEDDDHDEAGKHTYWYARVIGIFHVNVKFYGRTNLMHVPWVRWFGRDLEAQGGFNERRLHHVGFVDGDDVNAFGFIDPAQVLRTAHLIPTFTYGQTEDIMGPSVVRQPRDKNRDDVYFYVNMFVDRDMFMRYLGGGVGHKGTVVNRCDIDDGWVTDNEAENEDDEGEQDRVSNMGSEKVDEESDNDADVADEEDDFGYRRNDGDEGDESGDEENGNGEDDELGPEDGEDAYAEDLYDEVGYGAP